MNEILLDYRCPKCNSPVCGTQEVKHVERIPKQIKNCQNCKIPVKASNPELTDLGIESSFERVK